MAAGLPVIAFDCVAGPSDMIEDGQNGFLIPLFNQKIFAEKLSHLMSNERMREQMGTSAIQSTQQFNPELIGKKYNDFLFASKKPVMH